MIYFTQMAAPRTRQLRLEQILEEEVDVASFFTPISSKASNTLTRVFDRVPERLLRTVDADYLIGLLEGFCSRYSALYIVKRHSLYSTFSIPKKTGGLRTINAPNDDLKAALYDLGNIFTQSFLARWHTTAFAYVPGRSTVDALRRHQQNDSHWFLKLDFSNFFGSTTENFLFDQLSMIFPFSEVVRKTNGAAALRKALSLCMLDGGLPQGTPISPMLTNLMMIPIDHQISNTLHGRRMVYTRYADDIMISAQRGFDPKEISALVQDVLRRFHAPFAINDKKTHYGSRAGNNWCLGLMLNAENKITIGWRNVDRFKAMCNSYILDRQKGIRWELHDVQTFAGLISYYTMVEKDYILHVIDGFNKKYKTDLLKSVKEDLGG